MCTANSARARVSPSACRLQSAMVPPLEADASVIAVLIGPRLRGLASGVCAARPCLGGRGPGRGVGGIGTDPALGNDGLPHQAPALVGQAGLGRLAVHGLVLVAAGADGAARCGLAVADP